MKKQVFGAILALSLVCAANMPAQADRLQELKDKGSVRVAVAIEPPYTVMDGEGNLSGAVPDVTRAALKRMGINEIDVQVTDWGALIPGLQARRFDMISSGLYIREDRCKAMLFSQPDTCTRDVFAASVNLENPPRSYTQIAANPDLKIAVCGGCSHEKDALAAGVSRNQLVMMNDVQEGLDLVLSGRADLFAAPDLSSQTALDQSGTSDVVLLAIEESSARCGASGFHMSDVAFRDAFDEALQEIKDSGEYTKIVSDYGFNAELAVQAKRADFCPMQK